MSSLTVCITKMRLESFTLCVCVINTLWLSFSEGVGHTPRPEWYPNKFNTLIRPDNGVSFVQELVQSLIKSQDQCDAGLEGPLCELASQVIPGIFEQSKNDTSSRCVRDLQLYLQQLLNGSFWALSMFDATGKIPDGVMEGHLFPLGNYDECININPKSVDIQGKYCLVFSKGRLQLFGALVYSITRGLCIPASCHAQEIEKFINIFSFNNSLVVLEKGCSTKEPLEWRTKDKIFMSLLVFLVAMVLLCSFYDGVDRYIYKTHNHVRNEISIYHSRTFLLEVEENKTKQIFSDLAKNISIFHNFEKIITITANSKGISCIHGLRFYSICWVVLGHQIVLGSSIQFSNNLSVLNYLRMFALQPIVNATVSVDTFFVMSGALACFGIATLFEATKFTSLFSFLRKVFFLYVGRYLRLTPALALIVGYSATINILVSDGPFWKIGTTIPENVCVDNWWKNLLYIQNYVDPNRMCVPHSWYLACDMQFFLILPFLVIVLLKSPFFGSLFVCALILGSNIFTSLAIYTENYPPSFTLNLKSIEDMGRFFNELYIKSHARFGSYGIGILLGCLLKDYKEKPWKPNKLLVAALWMISTASSLAIVYGLYSYNRGDEGTSKLGAAIYGGFHRTAWAVCISWIIFACYKGYGGVVNWLLSFDFYIPLGRLTYCTYLISMIIQNNVVNATRSPIYFEHVINPYFIYIGELAYIFAISFVATLFLESPWVGITKMLLGRSKQTQGKGEVKMNQKDEMSEISKPPPEFHQQINGAATHF